MLLLLQLPAISYSLVPWALRLTSNPEARQQQNEQRKQQIGARIIALAAGIHFSFALGVSGMLVGVRKASTIATRFCIFCITDETLAVLLLMLASSVTEAN
jgi:hypothetical protein